MSLYENVVTLQTLLPALSANDAKFAADLIAYYGKHNGLTVKQEPWIAKLIARATTPKQAPVVAAPAVVSGVNVGGFENAVALFNVAKEHLKFPKVRLVVAGKHVVLSLNGKQSKAPGYVSITSEGSFPNRTYYGRVSPDGVFTPAHATYGDFLTALTSLLTEFSSNPARVAKDHGKLTGHCCFCNRELGLGKEQRSVLVGFGPDCAEHYGLKAEWLAAADKAEAKASVVPVTSIEVPAIAIEVPEAEETVYDAPLTPAEQDAVDAFSAGLETQIVQGEPIEEPTLTVSPEAQAVLDGLGEYAKQTYPEWSQAFAEQATLTVTPEAQAALETLATALGTVAGVAQETHGALVGLAEANQAALQELEPSGETWKECYFCETLAAGAQIVQSLTVCPKCVAQLA